MKSHKSLVLSLIFAMMLLLTGCGTALYEMTDAEEEAIVLYSAKLISQYNRAQTRGYCYVSNWQSYLEEDEPQVEEELAEGEELLEGVEPEATQPEQVGTEPTYTMTEALGVDNLTCEYVNFELSSSYVTEDIAIGDADEGYCFLLVRFTLVNAIDQDRTVNLLTSGNSYTLVVNGDAEYDCYSTLSMEDLSTYYNSGMEAWESDSVVLIFQVPEALSQSISNISLKLTRDGQEYRVEL